MAYKIYRIESIEKNPNGIGEGCYRKDIALGSQMMSAHNTMEHLSIRDEFTDWYDRTSFYREHYCAFRNIAKLVKWFGLWLPYLMSEELEIVEYTVNDYLKGMSGKQIMFHPDKVVTSKSVMSGKGGSIRIASKIAEHLTKL